MSWVLGACPSNMTVWKERMPYVTGSVHEMNLTGYVRLSRPRTKPLKNSAASNVSMANCTAWLSVCEMEESTMPSDSDARSTPTTMTANHATSPENGTPRKKTADAVSAAATADPTHRYAA